MVSQNMACSYHTLIGLLLSLYWCIPPADVFSWAHDSFAEMKLPFNHGNETKHNSEYDMYSKFEIKHEQR